MTADRRAALDALLAADAELVMDIDTTAVKRRAALVEKVAKAVALTDAKEGYSETLLRSESYMMACRNIATAAIDLIRAEVLEEAARVAETVGGTSPEDDVWQGAYKAAAAIRALKDAPPNNALTEPTAGLSANP